MAYVHAGLAVLGVSAVPVHVHDIRCKMKDLGHREDAIVLDCMMDSVDRATVKRAASVIRDMHRDARAQGLKMRVQIGAAANAEGNVVLTDGSTQKHSSFVRWLGSLVAKRNRGQQP